MSFQKKWNEKRKKSKPNKILKKPIIGFRSNLCLETLGYIKKLSLYKQKSNFINQAIEQRYFMITNKRKFLRNILIENYELARFLLRKIGGKKK